MKNGVFYFGISSFISEIFKFLLKNTVHMNKKSQNWELNISENIGCVLFKLGSGNLCQVRHKMILIRYAVAVATILLLGLFNAGLIVSYIVLIRHVLSR